MRVFCAACGRSYNDLYQYTLCPHNPLEAGPRPEDYCRKHDLFGPCPLCNPEATNLHPQTAGVFRAHEPHCPVPRAAARGEGAVCLCTWNVPVSAIKARKRLILKIAKSISDYIFRTHNHFVEETDIEQLIAMDLPMTYGEAEAEAEAEYEEQAKKDRKAAKHKSPPGPSPLTILREAMGHDKGVSLVDTIIGAAELITRSKLCKSSPETEQQSGESSSPR